VTRVLTPVALPGVQRAPVERARSTRCSGWQGGARLLSRRTLRRALGVLWLLDALLQAEPSNFAPGYPRADLLQSIMGAPGWERRIVVDLVAPFTSHWPWWNWAVVALQATIGLALVADRWARPALVVAVGWCAVVWLTGEGLGMLPTGFALLCFGAPGPAVLYAILGLLAWPSAAHAEVDRSWWRTAWITYWGGGALLQLPWVYPLRQVLRANVEETSIGQPAWLESVTRTVWQLILSRPVPWLAGLWAAELGIALAALGSGRALRAALAAATVVSVVFWLVGQQLGGALAPTPDDVGTGPLVILLALSAWGAPRRREAATAPGAALGAPGVAPACSNGQAWAALAPARARRTDQAELVAL
jgi:hypothetical protein